MKANKRVYLDLTFDGVRVIQDEKGQTIITENETSFVSWEVLEMSIEEIREQFKKNSAKGLFRFTK